MYQKAVFVSENLGNLPICGLGWNVGVLVRVCECRADPRPASLMGQVTGQRRDEVTDQTDPCENNNSLSVGGHSAVEMHIITPRLLHTHETHKLFFLNTQTSTASVTTLLLNDF